MLDLIKKRQQNRIVRQMLGIGRKKQIVNMDQIRSVGIIFTVGDERQWNIIYDFAKRLTKEGKDVWLCGYQKKSTTTNYIFTHTQSVICHEKEDTQFGEIPKEGVLNNFTSRHYDLLIDATMQPNFFGKYVALKTLADLKATRIDKVDPIDPDLTKIFDFMIRGDETVGLDDYFEETKKYLSMIQK